MPALATRPGFSGIRLFAIGASPPAWLDDTSTDALWDTAAELGLRMVVALLPPDLPRLRRRLEWFTGPVVLDHCGFPDLRGGPPYPGAAGLFALAGFGTLHLKLTSHLLEGAEAEGDPHGRALVTQLVATFGAERLVWGSDYPQTHDRTYAELVALGEGACAELGDEDSDRIMAGNTLRLWPTLARPLKHAVRSHATLTPISSARAHHQRHDARTGPRRWSGGHATPGRPRLAPR